MEKQKQKVEIYKIPKDISNTDYYVVNGITHEDIEISEEEFNSLTPNEIFDKYCDYEGLINYGGWIRGLVKQIYEIDLNEISNIKREENTIMCNNKEENKMKVVVLRWGKQDEIGRVFYHDTHVELFKTEEEAQTRVLELGKEFVPEAKDTEELANGLIMLEDEDIPSMYFDIDTIEINTNNTKSREIELLNNAFEYLTELISDDEERKRVLMNSIGLTKQELDEFGFCFE